MWSYTVAMRVCMSICLSKFIVYFAYSVLNHQSMYGCSYYFKVGDLYISIYSLQESLSKVEESSIGAIVVGLEEQVICMHKYMHVQA